VLLMLIKSVQPVMDKSILIPDNHFNFSNISLMEPVSLQGGTYFTKLLNERESLYVQTPQGTTKQGFVKSSKKIHNDLVFEKSSDQFIQWIVDLEAKCTELIYQNSNDWFQQPLDLTEIESAFNTIVKVNKSNGYIVRSNVKIHTMTKEPVIKVYNQSETILTMADVVKDTNVITILEVQGVKFTSKSFQLETEIKQMMVLDKDIFDTCLIKPSLKPPSSLSLGQPMNVETSVHDDPSSDTLDIKADNGDSYVGPDLIPDENDLIHLEGDIVADHNIDTNNTLDISTQDNAYNDYEEDVFEDEMDMSDEDNFDPLPKLTFGEDTFIPNIEAIPSLGKVGDRVDSLDTEPEISLQIEDLSEEGDIQIVPIALEKEADDLLETFTEPENMENTGDSEILVNSILEDVEIPRPEKNEFQDLSDIALEIDDETIHLNTPDKHYYELFEKVRSEAKEAKKRAKEAYLKAKNIKKSYMLETMSESSDETIDSLLDMDDMDDMNDMDDMDENTQTEELTLET